jgi:hypothetical protein
LSNRIKSSIVSISPDRELWAGSAEVRTAGFAVLIHPECVPLLRDYAGKDAKQHKVPECQSVCLIASDQYILPFFPELVKRKAH